MAVASQIRFVVPGRPRPKGRPRADARFRGRRVDIHFYTPRETKEFEQLVGTYALAAGARPVRHPVEVEVEVWLAGKRGDGDNYLKAILDGLNGVAWEDDRQVVAASIRVHEAQDRDEERTEVTIREARTA